MRDGFEEPVVKKPAETETHEPPDASRPEESGTLAADASKTAKSKQKKPQKGKDASGADKGILGSIRKWTHPDTVSGLTLTLFAITAIVALVLSLGHFFTKDIIAQREADARNEAMSRVMQADVFEETENKNLYLAKTGGETTGYALIAAPKGYGGAINMIVGVDLEFKIIGVSLVSMSETPGYGSRAVSEPWFFQQFTGKALPLNYGDGAIDALAGATVTSDAILKGLREALKQTIDYATGGGGA